MLLGEIPSHNDFFSEISHTALSRIFLIQFYAIKFLRGLDSIRSSSP